MVIRRLTKAMHPFPKAIQREGEANRRITVGK